MTWSHFIELAEVSDPTKRLFYQQMSILYHWSVRQLRDQEDKMVYERSLIAAKPNDEQVKVLTTVADGDITSAASPITNRPAPSWEGILEAGRSAEGFDGVLAGHGLYLLGRKCRFQIIILRPKAKESPPTVHPPICFRRSHIKSRILHS